MKGVRALGFRVLGADWFVVDNGIMGFWDYFRGP